MSWLEWTGGYELFFNRDEARHRERGLPPRAWQRGAVRFLAPVDPAGGGTWLAVNEFGLSVGLLNYYRPTGEDAPWLEPKGTTTSRGLLVERLAASASVLLVRAQLTSRVLASFRPFTLIALAPGEAPWIGRWNGHGLETVEPPQPLLSSSGYDAPAAEAARRKLWRERIDAAGGPTHEQLHAFHRSHEPEIGARSPCMHREEAATLSLTHVRVDRERVAMRYTDGPPCRTPMTDPLEMRRSAEVLLAES